MICPQCKCEYLRGVTQCADCAVPLVDKLEPDSAKGFDTVRIVPAWRGRDSSECERVQEALESAGIPFSLPGPKSSFSYVPTDPWLEIWIAQDDQERARKIILDLEGRVDPDELTPEQLESLALEESDSEQGDADEAAVNSDLDQQWDEDEPTNEVWAGDGESLANTLIACLREVGIASRKRNENGRCSVAVRPPQEARAKEIVREVVEASPPE